VPAPIVVRLFAVPNTDGPRVRVGFLWFLLVVPAVYFGPVPTAALFGLIAGIAALQTGQAWRRAGYRPSRLVALPFAIALPATAVTSYSVPGVVILFLPIVALAAAFTVPRRRRRTSALGAAGLTTACALAPGVAAMGAVYVSRLPEPGIALVFVAMICAYDVGSFLVGADARAPLFGIVAGITGGIVCTMAVTFFVFATHLPPFDGRPDAWVYGAMVAVFAPLGQIVASLVLPKASTWVPALRRLDSYIFTAPLWAWVMWSYLGILG
jgi:hypothetical protein